MGFSFKTAVILSLCALAGNYLFQVMINIFKRHPIDPTRPLIYYDIVLVLLPAELGGNNLGVIMSTIFPASVLYILAIAVLFIATFSTFDKGRHQYNKETAILSVEKLVTQPLLSNSVHIERNYSDGDFEENLPAIDYPWFVLSIIFFVFACYVALYLGLNKEQKCTWQYDLILTSIYPLLIAELVWGTNYLSSIQKSNPETKLKGDLVWNQFSYIPPGLSLVIGFLSGMLGIGGGELMGPMLLQWEVLPAVSVATTSFMSFLNTTSSVLHYLVLNEIPYYYGAVVFGIGCAAGFTGRISAIYIVRYFDRPSLFMFLLVVVLIISFCIFTYDLVEDSTSYEFQDFCSS